MTLWAVTMVKDELDVLPYTLQHLASEGVDVIHVADNLSSDGTWEWLQEADVGCELIVTRDEEVGYYQSLKMTLLAQRAIDHGADWVLPFDADELWYCTNSAFTLADAVAAIRPTPARLLARLYDYFPFSDDDADEPNPFLRLTHRDTEPAPVPKVLPSAMTDLVIHQGNHGSEASEPFIDVGGLVEIAHAPWRSAEQFERKVRNGYAAYEATDLPEYEGAHWREYGRVLEAGGPEAVHQIFYEWFQDPPGPTEHHPAPWCRSTIGRA